MCKIFAVLLFCSVPLLSFAQAIAPQDANLFTGKDATAVITNVLTKQGLSDNIEVGINEVKDEDILTSSGDLISVDTSDLRIDRSHNTWQATLLLKTDGHNLAPVKLSGRYGEMTQIPVLRRRIAAGEVITEEDISWDKLPAQHLYKNIIASAQDFVGKSPKHVLSQGRPIRVDEIVKPAVVNKGVQVTLLYRSGNLEIETFGQTLESGAKGDVIRVRNTTSKVVIQGTVESATHVRVTSPDSDSAEAM